MIVTSVFRNDKKDLTVTLKTEDGNEYDWVVLGDEEKLADSELMKMTAGESFGDWVKQ